MEKYSIPAKVNPSQLYMASLKMRPSPMKGKTLILSVYFLLLTFFDNFTFDLSKRARISLE
jgi:hypothetical protein